MQIDESLLYVGHEASPLPNEKALFSRMASFMARHRRIVIATSGAGGNRTPVHQPLNARDTTIPNIVATQQHRRVDWLMPKH